MSEMAAHGALAPPPARTRSLIVPREHGAWGMLLVPLVTGAAVGLSLGHGWMPLALLVLAALSIFWLRTPVESWLGAGPMRAQGTQEVNAVVTAVAALGSVALVSLAALLWDGPRLSLALLGAVAAVAFGAQALMKRVRRLRMTAQTIGAIGLTSTAAAAYCVAAGRLDARAFALWAANWLFAGDQIHFVQLRIHASRLAGAREKLSRGRAFLVGQAALAIALAVSWYIGRLPALAALAFVPVLARGFLWFASGPQTLAVKRLGWTELAHSVTFGALLVAGFLLG
jgi:hypothetical protein